MSLEITASSVLNAVAGQTSGTETVEVAYQCEFSADRRFGGEGTVFVGAVSKTAFGSATDSPGSAISTVECELPVIDMPSSVLMVRLRFTQTPRAFDLEALSAAIPFSEYSFTGANPVSFQVIPRPYLSSVLPLTIFNIATVERLDVTGERFENAGSSL